MLGGGGLNFPFDTYYEGKLKSSPGYVAGQALGNLDIGKLVGLSTIAKALSAQRGTPVGGAPLAPGAEGPQMPQAGGAGGMGNDMILPMLMMDPSGGMGLLSKFLDPSVQADIAAKKADTAKTGMEMTTGLPYQQAALAEATRAHKEAEDLKQMIAQGQKDSRDQATELTNENRKLALQQARAQFIAKLHTQHPLAAMMPWSATSQELKKLDTEETPTFTAADAARLKILQAAKKGKR